MRAFVFFLSFSNDAVAPELLSDSLGRVSVPSILPYLSILRTFKFID
jgi:hypothetical protein